jgi:hypothetical protein
VSCACSHLGLHVANRFGSDGMQDSALRRRKCGAHRATMRRANCASVTLDHIALNAPALRPALRDAAFSARTRRSAPGKPRPWA